MACKPTNEVLKELREIGLEGNSLKAASELLKLIKQSEVSLGAKTSGFDTEGLNKIEKEVHGDVEAMKELLQRLNGVDGVQTTESHMNYLIGLIDNLKPRNFTKMTTWINEKANENGGMINAGKLQLNVSEAPAKAGNDQSAAEIYTHEIIHAYTAFALRSNTTEAKRIERELRFMMDVARKNMSYKDLLPEVSIDQNAEVKNAKAMWDYVFNNDKGTGLDEFIAHVLTNPAFISKTKDIIVKEKVESKSLFDKAVDMARTILDVFFGDYEFKSKDKNVQQNVMTLVMQLAENNNKAIREARENEGAINKWVNMLNDVDLNISRKIEDKLSAWEDSIEEIEPFPRNASKLQYARWLAYYLPKLILKPKLRPYLEIVLSTLGMKPEGFVQNLIRDIRTPDELERTIERLDLQSSKIDQTRENIATSAKEGILQGFKKTPSKQQQEAITAVLIDTDVQSLDGKYNNQELRAMLTDEAELDRRISRAKHVLKTLDKDNYNFNVSQASGLGYYIATGRANAAQNLNARNIARGLLSPKYRRPKANIVKAIDEVSTLVGLKFSDDYKKAEVAELMKTEYSGVRNVIETHRGFTRSSKDLVFRNKTTNMIKGYSKEIFDESVTAEVRPLEDKAYMESNGYTLVKELTKDSRDTSKKEMGLYISKLYSTHEYYRTATRLTNLNKKGTTLTDIRFKGNERLARRKALIDIKDLDRVREGIIKSMIDGTYKLEDVDSDMVPLMDDDGNVVDYRYLMDKETKKDLLEQNTEVGQVLGRSLGSIFDKSSTEEHNKSVLDLILRDMEDNYTPGQILGKNDKEYVKIVQNSPDKKIKELYEILPTSFKNAIKATDKGYIAIRQDMLINYFGFRHLSIMDSPLKHVTPVMMQKITRLAEMLWQEVIKISKVDILIRTPVVIIENIVSNFMYSVMTGTNPLTLIRLYLESARNVRDYLNKHKELTDLEIASKSGNVLKKDLTRMNKLREDLKSNSVHELMEVGIYQAIIEDISTHDLRSGNKLSRKADELLENTPGFIRDGAQWLYLGEKTKYFQIMTNVLQASDLIARDIENQKLKLLDLKQADGKMELPKWWIDEEGGESIGKLTGNKRKKFLSEAKKRRLENILDAFINYNKPSTNLEEYANRMGMVMFTKYAKRIQRVIGKTGFRHPVKTFLILLGQEYLVDVETIADQAVVSRSWSNLDQDIIDHLERLVPISVRAVY